MSTAVEAEFTVETQKALFASLALDCGVTLRQVEVAYETYGTLNAARDNAILVLHAFSGDAHAAGISKETGQPGWWSPMVGPGLAFDTNRYFVISSNVLGGCRGTTGPSSIDPKPTPLRCHFPRHHHQRHGPAAKIADRPSGYPAPSRGDRRIDGRHAGTRLDRDVSRTVAAAIPIAATARHSAQQIAFNEVGRQAVMADLDWAEGNYYEAKPPAPRSCSRSHGWSHHLHE